ncbi:MAG TPA: hypothetical protein VFO16_04105 [Pseudonocardiaceae bacterium]|nr:hypothetical protein [Pseudonocardiaceae bacterium]
MASDAGVEHFGALESITDVNFDRVFRINVARQNRQPIIELLSRSNESVIGLGQRGGRPGRISLYDGNGTEKVRI